MKTLFHAATAVSADKVSHLLSNEFCMRHVLTIGTEPVTRADTLRST